MILVAVDTATPPTVTGVLLGDGRVVEARDDPPAGSRGDHAARVLPLLEQALARGGVGLGGRRADRRRRRARRLHRAADRHRHGARAGPGARAARRACLLARRARRRADGPSACRRRARRPPRRGLRRVWAGERRAARPRRAAPEALAERLLALDVPVLAVGDGAVRFRPELEGAGAAVPTDGSAVHRIAAAPLCRLGAAAEPADRDRLLPDYRREPDAKPPRR